MHYIVDWSDLFRFMNKLFIWHPHIRTKVSFNSIKCLSLLVIERPKNFLQCTWMYCFWLQYCNINLQIYLIYRATNRNIFLWYLFSTTLIVMLQFFSDLVDAKSSAFDNITAWYRVPIFTISDISIELFCLLIVLVFTDCSSPSPLIVALVSHHVPHHRPSSQP